MAELTKIKSGKNCSIWSDGKSQLIKIEKVRCSFPFLGKKAVNKDDDTGKERSAWQITPMLPKATMVEAKEMFVSVMNKLLLENGKDGVPVKVEPQNKAIKNGDDKDRKEWEGHWIISCSNPTKRPTVRTVKGDIITDEAKIDEMFYGGCWVSVMLRPWYFNGKAKGDSKTYPKRVSCGIVTVQFIKDDEPFGDGRVDDTNAWGDASDDSDGADDGLGASGDDL